MTILLQSFFFLYFQPLVGAGLDPPAPRYEGGTVKTVPYSP